MTAKDNFEEDEEEEDFSDVENMGINTSNGVANGRMSGVKAATGNLELIKHNSNKY
jgi:hypothetical protein